MNVVLASLFLLIFSQTQQAGFADDENSTKSVLNTVLSWHLYDFSPDDIVVTKSLSVVDEKPRTLFFDGNSSSIEFDSPLVNTTHIIIAATIKPLFDGKDGVIVNVPDKFNLELKNHTEGYYLTMEIRENSLWHVFQFPNPIFKNYTHVFAMYDGQTATLGMNGEYKTYAVNQDENNVFDDSKYVEFEKIPPDVIYANVTTISHIHIGEMHYHGRHYNFFLGQIGDVVIYPIQNYTSSLLFTQTNSTFANNVGMITSQTNVTEIPTNVTEIPTNVTEIPTNVTEIPTNVTEIPTNVTEIPTNVTEIPTNVTGTNATLPIIEIPSATTSMNFSNTLNASNVIGRAEISQTGINGTSLALSGKGLVAQNVTSINKIQELTVSAWVKPDYSQGSRDFTVLSKERAFSLVIHHTVPPVRIAVFSIFDGVTWHSVESQSQIPSRWTHLGATFNGTSISIYVNGKKESSLLVNASMYGIYGGLQTKTIESIGSNADVLIGGQQDLIGSNVDIKNLFSGKIDQVSLYNYTLSEEQINAIYETPGDSYKIEDIPITPHTVMYKTSYMMTEKPELRFDYIDNTILQKENIHLKKSTEPLQYSKWSSGDETINVEVFDPDGKKINLNTQFKKLQEGQFDIQLSSMRDGKAGLYKVKTTLTKGSHTYVSESDYQWGLVSLNTDRSIYKPGQTANFTIVVLDNMGHPVCNSDVTANIVDPTGHVDVLSTGNGIIPNLDCGLYDGQYHVNQVGNYSVSVVARNPSGVASFHTSFETRNYSEFDIVRTADSKLDPVGHPNSWDVNMDVISFVNQNVITIKESVPSVFNITTDANVQTLGDTKILTWTKSLIGNRTSVHYTYSIPSIFPQLYALGPSEIDYGQNNVFLETRPWFVAADPSNTININSAPVVFTPTCSPTTVCTTGSYTVNSGTDIVLVVGIVSANGNNATGPVTYGGVNMVHARDVATTTRAWAGIWYLVNPPHGANTISATWTTAPSAARIGVIAYNGVDQISPVGGKNSATGSSTAASVSVSAIQTNSMVFGVVGLRSGGTISGATSGTIEWNSATAAGAQKSAPSVGSTAITFTNTNTNWAIAGVEFKASGSIDFQPSDSMGLSDALTKTVRLSYYSTDSIGLSDILNKIANLARFATDSVGLNDILTKLVTFQKSFTGDSLGFTDNLNKVANLTRPQSVSVGFTDNLNKVANLTRPQSVSVGFTDNLNKVANLTRPQSVSVGLVDTLSRTINLTRPQSDSVGFTDNLNKVANLTRPQSDSVGFTDNLNKVANLTRPQSDSVGFTDNLNKVANLTRPQSDSVGFTDTVVVMKTLFATLTGDSVGFTDNLNKVANLTRPQSVSVGFTDNLNKVANLTRPQSDSVGFTDNLNKVANLTRPQSDSVGFTDNLNKVANLTRPQSVSVGFTDTVVVMKTLFATLTGDSVGFTDNLNKVANLTRPQSVSVGLNDTFTKLTTLSRHFDDSAGLVDTVRLTKIGPDQYAVPDNQTQVVVNSNKPHLVVTNSSAALSSIIIPSNVTLTTLSYSHIVSSGTVHLPHTLNITKDTNADNKPEIVVTIPAVTDINNPSWDGILQLPTNQSSSLVIPTPQGQVATKKIEIGLGSSLPLTFNNATRILFVGQAGSHVGFFYAPASVTEITQTCSADNQNVANTLPAGGNCKIAVGSNLVVWTKHFTGFVTWTLSFIPPSPQIPTSSGGYGTGVITSGMLGGGTTGVESAAGMSSTGVTLYDVTYDICDKQNVQFTVGSPDQTIPSVRFATESGVIDAKVSSHQPYAGLYDLVKQNVISYDASLKPGTKTFNMLVVPGNGTGYVTAKIDVTKCKQTVTFAPIPIIGQYSPDVPKIFDVKLQIGNETKIPASETQNKYVANQNVTVYGLVYSPVRLDHVELRTVKIGDNASDYSLINATIAPIQISNNYIVSATLPREYLVSPAVNYWVYAKNIEGFEAESDQYSIGVSPSYGVSGEIGFVMPQNVPAGLTQSPQVYFTNNATGVLYGTISLVVDGKQISQFTDHVFNRGTSVMELNWDVPKTNDTATHTVQAIASFYGHVIQSDKAEIHSYAPTRVISLGHPSSMSLIVDDQGNTVATPKSLYSSFVSDNSTKFHVVSPGGLCVIGESTECLVDESTITKTGRYSSITVNGQSYSVYYSGADNPLQRFTITSPESIVGDWKITLEKNGIEQKDLEDATLLKIKFSAVEKQLLISLP